MIIKTLRVTWSFWDVFVVGFILFCFLFVLFFFLFCFFFIIFHLFVVHVHIYYVWTRKTWPNDYIARFDFSVFLCSSCPLESLTGYFSNLLMFGEYVHVVTPRWRFLTTHSVCPLPAEIQNHVMFHLHRFLFHACFNLQLGLCCVYCTLYISGLLPQIVGVAPEKAIKLTVSLWPHFTKYFALVN